MRVEQVFITPILSTGDYGAEIEVSEYINIDGLSKVKRSIDSTDYSVGIFRFSELKLKCQNSHGTFNENDSRSIFPYIRDKSKVRVVAAKINRITGAVITILQFKGLIDESATRQNITNDTISLIALSNDSIFRTTNVPVGIISPETSAEEAIILILSQPEITKVLTVDPANISVAYNFAVDSPEELNNLTVNEALILLLIASSSALLVKNDEVFVQERENTEVSPDILELRGRGEITNNTNILTISHYNSGKQRQFNSVRLNDGAITITDDNSVLEYGFRQIEFDFPMVNNINTLEGIARNIAEEFRYQKIELKVNVPAEIAEDRELLGLVKIDAPWLKKPFSDNFLPILGVAVLGDTQTPLPQIFGSTQIPENIKFKIISIEENLKNFTTDLKLRQAGKLTNDGII